jgi:hypothetical protein
MTMTRSNIAAILIVAGSVFGCAGDTSIVDPRGVTIRAQSGDAQIGFPGVKLPVPISVAVTDRNGQALPGVVVQFSVTGGGGQLAPYSAGTDANGVASTTWTLGTSAETQSASAKVSNSPEIHAEFSATAKPPIMSIVSGNNQSGPAGLPLAKPLVIKVSRYDGSPVSDAAVSWVSNGQAISSNSRTDALGLASIPWTLAKTIGAQTVTATLTNIAVPGVSFSATAGLPIVMLGYDGASWRTVLADTSLSGDSLNAIWGASPTDVYAVGPCPNSLHYDGANWTSLPATLCGSGALDTRVFESIWGNSATDIFLLAFTPRHSPSLPKFVDHYDGASWTEIFSQSDCCQQFNAIWSRGPNDAFIVGDNPFTDGDPGIILHHDGTATRPQQTGNSAALRGIWGPATGTDVFAVGDRGTVLHYDGAAWSPQPTGTTDNLYAVWGTSANDVFAVGGITSSSGTAAATILHYDGTAWTSQTIEGGALHAVWGTSSNSVFAVGDGGTVLHYDGSAWTRQSAPTHIDLRGVWGGSPTEIFAVGAPR